MSLNRLRNMFEKKEGAVGTFFSGGNMSFMECLGFSGLDFVIIDCEHLDYIASSGLRILISLLKGAKAGGSRVVLKNVNEDILSVFKLTGFINIFEFE